MESVIGQKVAVEGITLVIAKYFIRENTVYYIEGFGALPITNVVKGILKATNNTPFHLRQLTINKVLLDVVVVYEPHLPRVWVSA